MAAASLSSKRFANQNSNLLIYILDYPGPSLMAREVSFRALWFTRCILLCAHECLHVRDSVCRMDFCNARTRWYLTTMRMHMVVHTSVHQTRGAELFYKHSTGGLTCMCVVVSCECVSPTAIIEKSNRIGQLANRVIVLEQDKSSF